MSGNTTTGGSPSSSGYVVAPAGCGKTHLIAESTGQSVGRQLILTHTYAGVNAFRRKMRILGVNSKLYRVDTIASWALRLSLSYSGTSGWQNERPANNEQWNDLYECCSNLLDCEFIRRILRASFDGVYVDEYQDCSIAQHGLVVKLARDLPSRLFGDPLQGIFDFGGQQPVDWAHHIEGRFQCLGDLDVPYRWLQTNAGELGEWLLHVRQNIERGQLIDLRLNLPAAVRFVQANGNAQDLFRLQGNTCRYFDCDRSHSVIAIHKGSQEYKAKCHILSRNLSGKYSSIEEVEGKDLFSFVRQINGARSSAASLKVVTGFAKKCMTSVEQNLPSGTLRGESVAIRSNTRNPEAARLANKYLAEPTSAATADFLRAIKGAAGVEVIRADLFNRAIGVLRKHKLHPRLTLEEAAEKYHGEFRHKGRPLYRRKLIGTTLLVKGLEFDHAIVLDATSLSKKELYVAMTRGARSLTIISTAPELDP